MKFLEEKNVIVSPCIYLSLGWLEFGGILVK